MCYSVLLWGMQYTCLLQFTSAILYVSLNRMLHYAIVNVILLNEYFLKKCIASTVAVAHFYRFAPQKELFSTFHFIIGRG